MLALPKVQDSLSRFERIVIALNDAPLAWRADFAMVAVSLLTEAYRVEAELARAEIEYNPVKLQRWSRSVDDFAAKLFPLLVDIENNLPVTLAIANGTTVMLTVDEGRVMLMHPRPSQQQVFEYNVLELFCQSVPCDQLLNDQLMEGSTRSSSAVVLPQWQFTATSRVCVYDGIRIVFSSDVEVGWMRETCNQLFQEVSDVLREIRHQANQSVRVEWQYLSLKFNSTGQQHLLQLNRAGDAIPLSVPTLYRYPAALKAFIPWVSAKLSGGELSVELKFEELQPSS